MKKQKGITLIALIITIIIMLILSGVVINLAIGKNGLFKTAKQAAKNYTNSEAKELADLNNITNIVDQTVNGETGGNNETGENEETEPNNPETPTIDESVLALKAGDYIKYNSRVNGEILCRVLYPASSEYGLQIVSDKNVKNVTLGSDTYSEAVESYNNAIETLNNEAEAYINTEYAYDARCIGSAPTIKNGMFINKDRVKFEGTTEYVVPDATNYDVPHITNANYINCFARDVNYMTDYYAIEELDLWRSGIESDAFWMASRNVSHEDALTLNGGIRIVSFWEGRREGSWIEMFCSYDVNYDEAVVGWGGMSYGLRPCFSLRVGDIKVVDGDGVSEDSPYILGRNF